NDEPMCSSPSELGLDPNAKPGHFQSSEGAGTQATLAWAFGAASGIETTQELSVDVSYALVPCRGAQGVCIVLAGLEVELPTSTVEGLTLRNTRFSLQELSPEPFSLVGGSFTIPDRALRFML